MTRPLPVMPKAERTLIGDRLRAARLSRSLTLDEVAQMTGLTKGFLSRIERDETSPSVATLVALCQVLSLPVGRLFEQPEYELVHAADAPLVHLGTTGVDEQLLTPRGQAAVSVLRSEVEPLGHGGTQLHAMRCEVEVLYMIRGTLEVRFADHTETLRAGDTLTFPGKEPHTWRNPHKTQRALAIWVFIPAVWNVDDLVPR
jgi:transcriptional regulator with XRE-family HTH domain